MTDITIAASDGSGSFSCYIARPSRTPAPVLVLIQEIFGVNAEMRKKCDDYAAKGYIAVCPDLFWRMEPNIQLTDKSKPELDKAFDLLNRFDADKGVADIAATIGAMRKMEGANGKVGCVGYCLGGKLAFMTACRTDVDASVGYYGVDLEKYLDEADVIAKPLMLHMAQADKFVTREARHTVINRLAAHPRVTIHVYPEMDHAFAREGGDHYNAAAARLANGRTAEFLSKALG